MSALLVLTLATVSEADIFLLRSGNRVEGTWVNRSESTPVEYVVRTSEGNELVLPGESVKRVVESSPEERQYQQLLPEMAETADGNWRMAEWCRKNRLSELRTRHLEAAIELDPDHADARRALGYTNRDGEWVRADDLRRQRGYVQYKGKWYLPQELELFKAREAREEVEREWRVKLRRWHGWLGGRRDSAAREQFELLSDPAAVGELVRLLEKERALSTQKLLVQTLSRFSGPTAELALVEVALSADDATLRELARDAVVEMGGRWAYPRLIAELQSKVIARIRRSAFMLGLLGNPEAIQPLIDVLVTVHRRRTVQGGPGAINTTFGSSPSGSGTGFSTGTRVKTEQEVLKHEAVLRALENLSGENFGYAQPAWRSWFADTTMPPRLDLRRGP